MTNNMVAIIFYIAIEILIFRCTCEIIKTKTKPKTFRRWFNIVAGAMVFIWVSLMLIGYMFG